MSTLLPFIPTSSSNTNNNKSASSVTSSANTHATFSSQSSRQQEDPLIDLPSSARSSLSTTDSTLSKRLSYPSSPDHFINQPPFNSNYSYYDKASGLNSNFQNIFDMETQQQQQQQQQQQLDFSAVLSGRQPQRQSKDAHSNGAPQPTSAVTASTTSTLQTAFHSSAAPQEEIDPFLNPFEINSNLWGPHRRNSVPASFNIPSSAASLHLAAANTTTSPRTPGRASFPEVLQQQQEQQQQQLQGTIDSALRRSSYGSNNEFNPSANAGSIWSGHRLSAGSATSPILGIAGLTTTSPPVQQRGSLPEAGFPPEYSSLIRRGSYDPGFPQILGFNVPPAQAAAAAAAAAAATTTAVPKRPSVSSTSAGVIPSSSPPPLSVPLTASTSSFRSGIPPNAPPLDYVKSFDNPYGAQQQQQRKQEEQLLDRFNNLNLVNYQDQYAQAYEEANRYFQSPPQETLNLSKVLAHLNSQQLPNFPGGGMSGVQLVLVCFKSSRLDVFYVPTENQEAMQGLKVGDLIIVEADRGRDLGKIVELDVTLQDARLLKLKQFRDQQAALNQESSNGNNNNNNSSEKRPALHFPKPVVRFAYPNEVAQLMLKKTDEEKARNVCQLKVKSHGLVMSITGAEYQWDRRKLTFYYNSGSRIDFRDLVKELFKIYKTRIWMCKQPEPIGG